MNWHQLGNSINRQCAQALLGFSLVSLFWSSISAAQEPVWDGNTVVLESKQLADGVFAVIPTGADEMASKGMPIATSSGFVIGDNGVLVIDSMLNKRLAKQLRKLIRAETRKPIRYIVNTSYHGDHSYGNYAFPATVTVIQHENTKAYVDRNIDEDKQFMIQNFGAGRGIEEAVPRTGDVLIPTGGQLTIDIGGQSVEIRDYGFAQTGGDLFVWHGGAKVLWTGNPIVAQRPALPWLLDGHLLETLDSLTAVYDAMPSDARIVPGHGPVMGREDLKWHIDYLAEIKSQVEKAVARGLSLEETVAEVQMTDYQGYALFGWVHPQLNVPAAYRDLSQKP